MTCPYTPKIFCQYIDTSGMDKTKEYLQCEHYIIPKPNVKVPDLQWIWHDSWKGFFSLKGNPLKYPAAFHLIYKWAIQIGFLEIRKFLNDKQMSKALEIYKNRPL
jgi:hypothetical protein